MLLINLLINLISGWYFHKLITSFVPLKEKPFYQFIAVIGCTFITGMIIYLGDMVNVTANFVGFLFMIFLCYHGPRIQALSAVLTLYPMVTIINAAVVEFFYFSRFSYDFNLVLRYAALGAIWFAIYHLLQEKIRFATRVLTKEVWLLIDVIALASLGTTFYVVYFTSLEARIQGFLALPFCLISSVGIFYLIELLGKGLNAEKENQLHQIQKEYYHSLEKEYERVKKLRHDMQNHLQTLAYLAQEQQEATIPQYIEQLNQTLGYSNIKVFCPHKVLNAVLNQKFQRMDELKIPVGFELNLPSELPFDHVDLCSIFANTLDNSIEASQKVDEPNIHLKAMINGHYFIYSISNQIVTAPSIKNGRYQSNKTDSSNHGWGLVNVENIVEKYDGSLEITHDTNTFSLTLIIPLQK